LTQHVFSEDLVKHSPNIKNCDMDKFGIRKLYPTKEGGREWFINMTNPLTDNTFSITFHQNISRQNDGGWRISGPTVRMNVNTPPGLAQWKNVEITGYAKLVAVLPSYNATVKDNDLSWYARGGRHNTQVPCEGTAYIGGLYVDGSVGWKKEIWFTGGYTDVQGESKVTNSPIGRWIGWKVVIYSINNDSSVKLESYIDNTNTNYWVKVTDLIDSGGWYSKSNDTEFYSGGCNRDKDYVITHSGPIATFSSDNLTWDFKNLSIREIDPEIRNYAYSS